MLEIESLLRSFAFRDEFSKIERLAIYNEISLEFYMTYGEILCDILALFGNVRDLTIVHKDYTAIRREECVKDMSRLLTFVEPVHMDRRAFMFENPEYHVNHDPKNQNLPVQNFM